MLCTAHFDIINFYQNRPKIMLFLPKNIQNFRALGAPPPDPSNSPPPPLQNSGYEPGCSTSSLVEE